jgi:hypothetical protein
LKIIKCKSERFISIEYVLLLTADGVLNSGHKGGSDVDINAAWGVDSAEILSLEGLVDADFNSKDSDGFSAEVNLDGEDVRGWGDIPGSDRLGTSESAHDAYVQNVVTLVLAVVGGVDQAHGEIVDSDIQNDLSVKMWLSSLFEGDGGRHGWATGVSWVGGASVTCVTDFDSTVSATSVTIHVISIVALWGVSESITTDLETEATVGIKDIVGSALGAVITVNTGQTSLRAGQALLKLLIEVGSDIAADSGNSLQNTFAFKLDVSSVTLADTVLKERVGLRGASLTIISHNDTVTNTCVTVALESWVTDAVGSIPVRVWNTDTSIDGLIEALSTIVESTLGAEASSIGIELSGRTVDTFLAVVETWGGADTLGKGVVPYSSLSAGHEWDALDSVVVWASRAWVGSGVAASVVPGKTGGALSGKSLTLSVLREAVGWAGRGSITNAVEVFPGHTGWAVVGDDDTSESVPIGAGRACVDGSLATSTSTVVRLSGSTGNGFTFLSIPGVSFFATRSVEALSILLELAGWADTESVFEDESGFTLDDTWGSIPLSSSGAGADSVGCVPDSGSGTGDAAHSVPVGVGGTSDTCGSVPVSSSADTVVNWEAPDSFSGTGSTVKSIPVGSSGTWAWKSAQVPGLSSGTSNTWETVPVSCWAFTSSGGSTPLSSSETWDTLSSIEVWSRGTSTWSWGGVPVLARGTCQTVNSVPVLSSWASTGQSCREPDLVWRANDTGESVPVSLRAYTGESWAAPDLSIWADNACSSIPVSGGANTLSANGIKDSSSTTGVKAGVSVPDASSGADTGVKVLIPSLSTITEDTDISVPVLSSRACTSVKSFVKELSSWAVDGTDESVVGLSDGALTLVGSVVVDSASSADNTGDSIPGGANGALTRLGVHVPGSAVGTDDTGEPVPELSGGADTALCSYVPYSSVGTSVNTVGSVPWLGSHTLDTGLSVVVGSWGAVSHTVSVVGNWVSATVRAGTTNQKEVVEVQISEVGVWGEVKLNSVPLGRKLEVGSVIVQDKSIEPVKVNQVIVNVDWGWVHQVSGVLVTLVVIGSNVGVLLGASHGNITDEEGLDLSGSSHGNSDSDSGYVDFSVDDLNFEGGIASEDSVRCDLESVKEGGGLNGALKVGSEGQ